ncbi:MAG: HlyD family efflux transporter periplasmic adaptor subunit [Candidatus Omnitrophica bacterium]|nr:HlyD family efflux transporter periplasmic adaptor subunit [Candidatus Omnitrophota bacterium]MDD5027105.1 HlyD family efflux transporter periplasmic adaptor subunit [Candidatus Omnitrophota bacterium]MDD5661928.1 HlyD family efflux transporter periplasmic adaptor subunit [Candidatus Omnitrophota bacterium]
MRKTKLKIIFGILVLLTICAFVMFKIKSKGSDSEIIKEIKPTLGSIQTFISTTGTVLPKNRLEVKPPVNGRIESISVQEGEKVKDGQVLAWMSSTERAALLDAAQGQGEVVLKYWEQVYKPISLLSPIDGEVIVATTQPGQTVTTSDAIVVLSDHLIIRAQVDETDIGKIKLGQQAFITLDAYLDIKIKATVDHIYYESETVNNVTIYKVDLIPEKAPEFFRSGMNATVDFRTESKDSALLLPVDAVRKEKAESYVLLKEDGSKTPVKRVVKIGITDDKNYEIISGVTAANTVLVMSRKYVLPSRDMGSNPFMPFGQKKKAK